LTSEFKTFLKTGYNFNSGRKFQIQGENSKFREKIPNSGRKFQIQGENSKFCRDNLLQNLYVFVKITKF
jgi:hypothetical protein